MSKWSNISPLRHRPNNSSTHSAAADVTNSLVTSANRTFCICYRSSSRFYERVPFLRACYVQALTQFWCIDFKFSFPFPTMQFNNSFSLKKIPYFLWECTASIAMCDRVNSSICFSIRRTWTELICDQWKEERTFFHVNWTNSSQLRL